ncbi:hypothetical protein [Streptomyces sp. NPDC050560]|uniref:hypothetical protein n=1 Tax=Streptomyces sp. NPDC050560 TaxID=3365630 RepID=UPI00379B313C
MASQRAAELERKLESIESDMGRVEGWQEDNVADMAEMGQLFNYLNNDQLRRASAEEWSTGQEYGTAKSASDALRQSDSEWREAYNQGGVSLADVQQVHTQYVDALDKTVRAARSHEKSMRRHDEVQKRYVEVVRNNILAAQDRQREMEKREALAGPVRGNPPTDNSHDPGGPSSSRRHDPRTRGHGTKKRSHGR